MLFREMHLRRPRGSRFPIVRSAALGMVLVGILAGLGHGQALLPGDTPQPPTGPATTTTPPTQPATTQPGTVQPGAAQPGATPAAPVAYDALSVDPDQKANRIKNLKTVKDALLATRFAPGEQQVFDDYFEKYALPEWTSPENVSRLPGFRTEVQRLLFFGKTGEPHDRLNDLIVKVLGAVALGVDPEDGRTPRNYHPAARVNSALMLGDLNAVEPVPGGPPAQPLEKSFAILLRIAGDAQQAEVVRVAAMVGLSRHVILWRAGGSQPNAAQQVQSLATTLALQKSPPAGRGAEGHAWLRAQALAILGELKPSAGASVTGPDGSTVPLAKAMADVAADADTPLLTRTAAMRTLGHLTYAGVSGLDPSQLASAVAQFAVDACAGESNPVNRRRLKARIAAAWFALCGEEWAPAGQQTPGAIVALAGAPPHQAVVVGIQSKLREILVTLDDRRIDDAELRVKIEPIRAALQQASPLGT